MGGVITKYPVFEAEKYIRDKLDIIFKGEGNEAEAAVHKKQLPIADGNLLIGILVGSLVPYGIWRASGNKSRFVRTTAVLSGGIFGMYQGALKSYKDFLLELLTLPQEKSLLAANARRILQEKIPENEFVKEVNAIMLQIRATRNIDDYYSQYLAWDKKSLPTLKDIQEEEEVRLEAEESFSLNSDFDDKDIDSKSNHD